MIEKRRFGRTGLQVPAVTFGGGWVGGILIHQPRDIAFEALDLAVAEGLDWIDTAASYGSGESETVIGAWLAGRPDVQLAGISTKFRVDPAAGDLSGQMLKSVENSLERLGLKKVDVVILHNQVGETFGFSTRHALSMADEMEALREAGLCDHIGMTGLGSPDDVRAVIRTGRYDVAQVYFNALNPTADWHAPDGWNTDDFGGLLRLCADHDMGTMGIRIFAGGHLASTERHGREIPITVNAGDAEEGARVAAIRDALCSQDDTLAQAALRFGLANDKLSTTVVGLAELAHLRLVINACARGALNARALEALDEARRGAAFTDQLTAG